jgi:hypothetical protein
MFGILIYLWSSERNEIFVNKVFEVIHAFMYS